MAEWTPYRCSLPAPGGDRSGVSTCADLNEVYHVAHVPVACRILEDGMSRAGLIGDESRLRRTRTSVTWVSANYWQPGSIYGTVEFTFPWRDLIKGRRVYWVEVMKYRPRAFRFLLTRRDLSGSKHVTFYDPRRDDGPLRRKGNSWYWNDQYTSEFMLDRDIDLDECTKLSFITHREDLCRQRAGSCAEARRGPAWAAGRVMAHILGKGLNAADHALLYEGPKPTANRLNPGAESGLNAIWRALAPKRNAAAGPIKMQESSTAVLRGALLLYGSGRVSEAKRLAALCHSETVFEKALTEIVRKHFGFRKYTLPP